VDSGQVQPERLGAFHQRPQIGVAAQQIVDQLPAQRHFAPDQVPARDSEAFGKRRDGLIENVQHRCRSGTHRLAISRTHYQRQLLPESPRSRQIQLHHPAGRDALLGRRAPEQTHCLQFPAHGSAPVDRSVQQQRQILPQQFHRHASGVAAGPFGHGDQPRPV
jgi:hypothetical protein